MKLKGIKVGLVFFVLSILATVTLVAPVFIIMFVEGIGKTINKSFNIGNLGGTTFYTCVSVCILCFIVYIFTLVKYKQNSFANLTLFFISIFVFLNGALFYYNIRLPNSPVDGQQIFDSVGEPIKTCLLYLFFGAIHDFYIKKYSKTNTEIQTSE